MSLALLLPFCCLCMPSCRGEAYLQRLDGKGRLRCVVSSSTVSVTLSPLSTTITPSVFSLFPFSHLLLSSLPLYRLCLLHRLPPPPPLPIPTTPTVAGPTSTVVKVPASVVPDSYTCTAVCVNSLLHARSGPYLAVSSMQSHQASATGVLGGVHPSMDAFPPLGHTGPAPSAGLVPEATPLGEHLWGNRSVLCNHC